MRPRADSPRTIDAVGSIRVRTAACASLVAMVAAMWLCASALAATAPAPLMTYITGLDKPVPQVWVSGIDGSAAVDLGPASSALISPSGLDVAAISIQKGATSRTSTLSLYTTSGGMPAARVIDGASFAPGSSDQVVYARAAVNTTRVNIYTASATGAGTRALTHDGLSEYPLWGPHGIVYSHETPRPKNPYPALQLWFMSATGSGAHELTTTTDRAGQRKHRRRDIRRWQDDPRDQGRRGQPGAAVDRNDPMVGRYADHGHRAGRLRELGSLAQPYGDGQRPLRSK